jgi:hypothetical protein
VSTTASHRLHRSGPRYGVRTGRQRPVVQRSRCEPARAVAAAAAEGFRRPRRRRGLRLRRCEDRCRQVGQCPPGHTRTATPAPAPRAATSGDDVVTARTWRSVRRYDPPGRGCRGGRTHPLRVGLTCGGTS